MPIPYEQLDDGNLKIDLSGLFKEKSRRNNLAFFFQKLVYLVCVRYLRTRIYDEIQKAAHNNGRSHWLAETLLYRSLSMFNSSLGDDHLFDKNDLRPLKKSLNFLPGHIVELHFLITLIGRWFSVISLGDGFFIIGFGEKKDEEIVADDNIQDALKDILENEM